MTALLLVVMLGWGLNLPVIKALTGVIDVVWVAVLRMAFASLTLTALLLVRDRRFPSLSLQQCKQLSLLAFLLIYLNQWLFVLGMRFSASTTASLVMALNPLLAVLAGAWVYREKITLARGGGVALGFVGVALVVLMAPQAKVAIPGLGELLLFLGLLAFIGGGLLIQRITRELDVLVIGWAVYLMGTLMLLTHALALGGWARTAQAFELEWVWWYAVYAGVLGTALANVGWYHAIGRIGQSQAGPHLYWLAVFGMVSSVLLLNESFTFWHAAGLVLVVAGIRLGSAPARAV